MSIDRRRSAGYVPLREAMNQLFEGSFISPHSMELSGGGAYPQADLFMTEDDVVLKLSAPGANPDGINISVTGDTVTVSGEVKKDHGPKGQLLYEEIWHGRFQRSFQLPIQVDANKADATFDNGVLVLTLPKSEATKPRKIQVRGQHTIDQSSGSQSEGGNVTKETVPVHSES